jgi:two-component system sensor histidine kinase MprB
MTLRVRLTLVAAAVVAIVVAAASLTVYFLMRHELYAQVDSELAQHAQDPRTVFRGFSQYSGDYVSLITTSGTQSGDPIPIDRKVKNVAAGTQRTFHRTATAETIAGKKIVLREIIAPIPGGAVVVARNIDYIEHDLGRLRLILILVSLGGIAAAALAGAIVSRATLAPVRRLTGTAERIAKTGDPSERVTDAGGRDEIARLGTAFNTMLAALEDSLETQRRFVADASHELRTPLTSLQTNIEVLKQQERLAPGQRAKLFADLEREAHEMRNLIAALLELARGEAQQTRVEVHLDEIVDAAVERARSRFPNATFESTIEPTTIEGSPERLERAVWNLIENAGKWTAPGSTVEVSLEDGEVRVRDHGPGIAAEDREHVFDRFYRATSARALPGSGLGLAIVRDVAEAHGGSVSAEDAPGGGALMRLRLASS